MFVWRIGERCTIQMHRMISIDNLTKKFGENTVVDIPKLVIPPGQRLGLVGNNGAGKTTLLGLLLDLVEPSTGTLFSNDINVHESPDWKGFTTSYLDESFLIDYLTPEEYFLFLGELRGLSKAEVLTDLEPFRDFFGGDILGNHKYLRDYSRGNRKKVGIAGCFLGSSEVVFLDEPFTNLDPRSQLTLMELLRNDLWDDNRSLLISSHDLRYITQVCDRVVLLEKGRVQMDLEVSEDSLEELHAYFNHQTSPGF